jgi:hypothetical protein
VAFVALVLAVVSGTAPGLGAQTVRDSAGIKIIDNTRPIWAPNKAWRLSPAPILDIGVSSGASEYQFQNIMGVKRLIDGAFVVADMGSSQLRWYDARGRFVRAVGRQGDGPDEFRQLMGVRRIAGDTLIAENSHVTLELYTAAGQHVSRIPLANATTGREGAKNVIGLFDDGTMAGAEERFLVQPHRGTPGETWIDSATVVIWSRNGQQIGSIGSLPTDTFGTTGAQPMTVTFGPALGGTMDGRFLYLGFSDQYAIRVYTSRGRLERVIQRAWTPHVVTSAELAAWKDQYANPNQLGEDGLPSDGLYRLRMHNLEQMMIAKTLPAFSMMHADRAGNLWVQEPRVSQYYTFGSFAAVPVEPATYSVFDPAGRWLGDVTVPMGVKVMEIGTDYLAGVRHDADDAEHVVVYRLEKP